MVLENYHLTPEDLKINLHDLMFNPEKLNLLALVEPNTKKALTMMYNKRHEVLKIKGDTKKNKQQQDKTLSNQQVSSSIQLGICLQSDPWGRRSDQRRNPKIG